MPDDSLTIGDLPRLDDARLLLAFSGWMDGGDVSTGTVDWLTTTLEAVPVGEISPEPFYIYNFPGTMELTALFRPHTEITEGRIAEFTPPTNRFHAAAERDLVLFSGKEPNLRWTEFADCIFRFCETAGIKTIYFVGSVAGAVPHTREPRFRCCVSNDSLMPRLASFGIGLTDYEGPAHFVTQLMVEATRRKIDMITLVAEVPAYIQGTNPKSIEAVVRKLSAILDLPLSLDHLRVMTDTWEKRIAEALAEHEDLAGHIHKLEEDYDNEVFDTQMGDLREWLQQRGIRLD